MQESRKVLFIEDDDTLAMGTSYALSSEGIDVTRVSDCAGAKTCWRRQGDQFDLVLLDVMLPDGDGFALCEWFKGEREDIPVIFLTALEDEGNVVHGLQYGDDYVTKPFRTKELIARIYANTRKAGREKLVPVQKETGTFNGGYNNGELRLDEDTMSAYRG